MKNNYLLYSALLLLIAAFIFGCSLLFSSCGSTGKLPEDYFKYSREHNMILGTYSGLPRLSNGRADLDRLIDQLKDLNANTYNWLIWQNENDWDDLKLFLPMALKKTGSLYGFP